MSPHFPFDWVRNAQVSEYHIDSVTKEFAWRFDFSQQATDNDSCFDSNAEISCWVIWLSERTSRLEGVVYGFPLNTISLASDCSIDWQCDFGFGFLSVMHDCSEQLNVLKFML
jgi:hypothetical protein